MVSKIKQQSSKLEIMVKDRANGKISDISYRDLNFLLSNIDTLTGLYNKKLLKDKLDNNEEEMTIIFVDIKDFGLINEIYGQDKADVALIEISNKLYFYFSDCDIYRVMSDIFCISCNGVCNDSIEDKKTKIRKIFDEEIEIDNEKIDIYPTMAIVKGIKNLFNKAETTLREAKLKNKEVLYYDKKMSMQRKERYALQNERKKEIKKAIRENRIEPYFQPIMCNKTNRIKKYESLLRIQKTDGTFYSSIDFLEISKNINMYDEITRKMVDKTLNYFQDKDIAVSINLSLQDITNRVNVDYIINRLKNFPRPSNIIFEILEDESVEIIDEEKQVGIEEYITISKYFFAEIKELGCKIAIDDFGSGYSNFINIPKINPNIIKIDGTIIKNLDYEHMQIMAETIISFAKKIKCEVVAEFVESEVILEKVKALGIDFSQGYHIGKPKKDILSNSLVFK